MFQHNLHKTICEKSTANGVSGKNCKLQSHEIRTLKLEQIQFDILQQNKKTMKTMIKNSLLVFYGKTN